MLSPQRRRFAPARGGALGGLALLAALTACTADAPVSHSSNTAAASDRAAQLHVSGSGDAGSNAPVVIVDGERFSSQSASAPDQIDPNIIEKIEVLEGPTATTLYGADAANGAVVITTKTGKGQQE